MFVNAPIDEVVEAAEREQLTILQLHGEEGPAVSAPRPPGGPAPR